MREQKGITLIALVITIIVLLILAGVTIAMLSGNDSYQETIQLLKKHKKLLKQQKFQKLKNN